jgi:hypothetical protein
MMRGIVVEVVFKPGFRDARFGDGASTREVNIDFTSLSLPGQSLFAIS